MLTTDATRRGTKRRGPTPFERPAVDTKAARKAARERFVKARRAEKQYGQRLRQVAKQVGDLIKGFAPQGVVTNPAGLDEALRRYAQALEPWARAVGARMVADVARRDQAAWAEASAELTRNLAREVATAPMGAAMAADLERQVTLITSLPLEAAQRVHELTTEALVATSARASEIRDMILASGHVTKSRAMLIARTEVARTATVLTRARAKHIGSPGYIWRTSADPDVRKDHQELEGQFVAWDDPPIADQRTGARAHAGSIYNCRCYAEPVLPDEL